MNNSEKTLKGRKLYIPQMSYESARCLSAAFQSIGVDAQPSPAGDALTYDLARRHLSGDECLPQAVTLGNFLKVTEDSEYDPAKTAFLMPTSNGPCRFGHYLQLTEKIMGKDEQDDLLVFSMSSSDGYKSIGEGAKELFRTGWRAVLASDILRKMLLKTRPYETEPGATDRVFAESLDRVCAALGEPGISHGMRLKKIVDALTETRDAFRNVPQDRSKPRPLIGIVGEIFCRLNGFSNDELIRVVERFGGEVWMSDVSEWVWYTNDEERLRLDQQGKHISLQMFGYKLKHAIMGHDEHRMMAPFKQDFAGYEEPEDVLEILERSRPYLPREGSHGEMVMSVGKAIWYHDKGAAGVIDISPFTCMNGIITEAIYPHVIRDLDGFPIRVFYFDGIQSSVESDVEIFMELAKNYLHKKQRKV